MNRVLLLSTLLWFGSPSHVNSVSVWNIASNIRNAIFGPPGPDPASVESHLALVLAVEKSGRIYLANNEFVKNQMHRIYLKFLFACPAEPDSEQESINEQSSKTKNALFIEEPTEMEKKKEFIEHRCKSPVKPSIIHAGSYEGDKNIDLYLVGYEVKIFPDKNEDKIIIDAFHSAALISEDFVWFNVYTIAFDRKQGNVVNVFSPMLPYNNHHQSETTSAVGTSKAVRFTTLNYPLGKNLFYEEGFKIEEIYGMDNLVNVFKNLFGDSGKLNYVDEVQERYLGEFHLATLDTFRIPLLKQAAQTYGNVALIWNFVYNDTWGYLEKYIDRLSKGLKAIHVITGTYGILELPREEDKKGKEGKEGEDGEERKEGNEGEDGEERKEARKGEDDEEAKEAKKDGDGDEGTEAKKGGDGEEAKEGEHGEEAEEAKESEEGKKEKEIKELKEIYLAPDNTVKVPAAFFKIVSYSPIWHDELSDRKIFNMLIVTSNNPYEETDQVNSRFCEKSLCKQFGWDKIEQDFYGMGRTTCCELTKENLAELKMEHMEQLIDETLDLNKVPHWSDNRFTLDLKTYVDNQMENIELDKPSDDIIYRNIEDMSPISPDDEEIFSEFVSSMYTNYVHPYFTKKIEPIST